MWSKPWSYKEGLVIGAGLLVIGLLLQMTVGAIHWDLFACPVNVIVLVVYIIALVAHAPSSQTCLFIRMVESLFRCCLVSIVGGRHDGSDGTDPAGSFRSCSG